MAKILVTGGAGYIGSHTIVALIEHGHEVISIDNLSRSSIQTYMGIKSITGVDVLHYEVDLCDLESTQAVFSQHPDIEGIIHFAAFKSVIESVHFPLMYFENNVLSLINILKCMQRMGISKIVFSSSCSVYGNITHLPVTEQTPLSKAECPYAASKQMGEQIIFDFAKSTPIHSILLRYFNPVGAHQSAMIGETPFDKPNNLVPVITQTAAGLLPKMVVWGNDYDTRDGTCIRDYIHVMDIARAHTAALSYLSEENKPHDVEIFNLGSGNGTTVLEAIHAFEKVSGIKLAYDIGPRRAGDVKAIYANNELAKEKLHWQINYGLDEMMDSAWKWQQNLMQNSKV